MKIMPPELLGIFITLQLIQNYGIQFHFGILNAVNRQIPYYLGKNDQSMAIKIEKVARSNVIIISISQLIVLLVVYNLKLLDQTMNAGVLAIGLATIMRLNMEFYIGIFKARGLFNKAALVSITEAVITILALPLVFWFSLEGLFWRSVLVASSLFVLCMWQHKWYFSLEFNNKVTSELLKVGFPIMLLGYGLVLLNSMDRILILTFLDGRAEAMGFYSLSIAVFSMIALLASLVGQFYYPRMVRQFAAYGISNSLIKDCVMASVTAALLTGLVAIAMALILPWFVTEFLTNYSNGIPAMKISFISSFILATSAGPNFFIITTEQKKKQGMMIGVAVMVIFLVGSKLSSFGILGISWSLVAGFSVYVTGLWYIVLKSKKQLPYTSTPGQNK